MAVENFDQVTIEPAKLRPFNRFIMSIGELPTSYLDSLSYAEQITWFCDYLQNNVIPAVNNNAAALEEVQNLMTQLQEYVDNYFTNLDVQEEINNKLDQLVLNGTLENLIGAYIQPRINAQNAIIENQNTRIDNIDIKVSAATNGSPLVASSTAGMTDTDKIYVNTSDGYWYYYNGSAWTQGGVYQTSGIGNGSVTYNNLESELQNSFVEETTITNSNFNNTKYIDGNGTEQSTNQTCYISLSVQPLESYLVSIPYNTSIIGTQQPVYMFKNNDTVISYKKGAELTITDNVYNGIIEIPTGVNTLIINQTQTGPTNINNNLKIVKVNRYIQNNIHKDQLDSKLKSIYEDIYTSITPNLFVNNALIGPNSADGISGYKIYSLNVNPGEKYKITINQIYNNPVIAFGNNNAEKTYTINGNDYIFKCSYDKIISSTNNYSFIDYEFTIPENCNVIYINETGNNIPNISKSTSYKIKVDDLDVSNLNPLNNKIITFVGDSITAATSSGVKGWSTLIAENNPTATVYNYGVDGATIANDGIDTNDILTQIVNAYTEHSNADYIIIQGGVNDYWSSNIELGSFEENSNFNGETPYNTRTFSGALEWIFNYCLNNFSGKKIGYIVTQKINSGSNNFYQYMDRAKAICKKWSIPYIDLFTEADLNYFVTSQKQNYSLTTVVATGDGCHPNLAGYQIITPKIENWLKYKI